MGGGALSFRAADSAHLRLSIRSVGVSVDVDVAVADLALLE